MILNHNSNYNYNRKSCLNKLYMDDSPQLKDAIGYLRNKKGKIPLKRLKKLLGQKDRKQTHHHLPKQLKRVVKDIRGDMEEDNKTFNDLFSKHDKYNDQVISKKIFRKACLKELYIKDDQPLKDFTKFVQAEDNTEICLDKLHQALFNRGYDESEHKSKKLKKSIKKSGKYDSDSESDERWSDSNSDKYSRSQGEGSESSYRKRSEYSNSGWSESEESP